MIDHDDLHWMIRPPPLFDYIIKIECGRCGANNEYRKTYNNNEYYVCRDCGVLLKD